MITGFSDNDNMMLVVELVVVFVVNFAMNKMRFRVDYTRTRGLSVGLFAALFLPEIISVFQYEAFYLSRFFWCSTVTGNMSHIIN